MALGSCEPGCVNRSRQAARGSIGARRVGWCGKACEPTPVRRASSSVSLVGCDGGGCQISTARHGSPAEIVARRSCWLRPWRPRRLPAGRAPRGGQRWVATSAPWRNGIRRGFKSRPDEPGSAHPAENKGGRTQEGSRKSVLSHPEGGGGTQTEAPDPAPPEHPLQRALELAATAGEWDVVRRLAALLEAERREVAGVVELEAERARRGG